MVVDVHAVESVRGYRRMDDRGMCVRAEADPAYLAGSPVLFENFQAAPFFQRPIELLHGVDAMYRKNVEVVHLRVAPINGKAIRMVSAPHQTHRTKILYYWEGHRRGRD